MSVNLMPAGYHLWRRVFFRWGIWNLLFRFWFDMHVEGWDNIPANGPVILMGNHIAAVDPVITVGFFPDRDLVPMAKVEAFSQHVLRVFVGHWDAIPVRRGEGDLQAMRDTMRLLKDGGVTMLYVEGTRSKTGLIEGQEGGPYLALKTNAVVVPMAIWGTRVLWRVWFKEFRRVPVYVRFGKPFRLISEERKPSRETIREMTDEVMYQISGMLSEKWRGIYHDLSKASETHLDFHVEWEAPKTRFPKWMKTVIPPEAYDE